MDSLQQILRTYLSPITNNLPAPLDNFAVQLLGQPCHKSLVQNLTITDATCMKLAVSKALGIAIISASSIVKIPQLLKILNSQSAEGVSFLAYLLETTSFLISLAYNARNKFPFSTYGEVALILIQNVAISTLVLKFSGQGAASVLFLAGLAVAAYAMLSDDLIALPTMQYLQAGAGLLGVASKVPQIAAIVRQGGTGQLSAFAVFNYLIGSLSRIFTTLQEVDDQLILYGFIAGFALNAVLAAQMVYYWNSPTSQTPKSKTTKKVEAAVHNSVGKTTGAAPSPKAGASTRRRG